MISRKSMVVMVSLVFVIIGGYRSESCRCDFDELGPLFSLAGSIFGCGEANTPMNSSRERDHSSAPKGNVDDVYALNKEKRKEAVEPRAVFIELGSVNCIPCRMMQPVMRQIEEKYGDRVRVIFYDVWTPEGRPYALQHRISAIPTQIFLDKNGREFFRHSGFFPFEEVERVLGGMGVH